MVKIFYAFIALLSFSALSVASLSGAEIFRWADEKGIVYFTDNPHNIPEKYRARAIRLKAADSPRRDEPAKVSEPDKASIPIQRKGQVAVVRATLNSKASASFVVDTGASYTMISRAMAKELEIDIEGKNLPAIPFQTANGVISAPVVTLESIDVGGMQVKDLTAAVYDAFPDSSVSGLLGLNFLSHFRMDIDSKNELLHLEKK
jgi:clan AA aspartic protease (TIGR02281 family)